MEVKATDLKQNLGEFLVRCEHEPVMITKHGKVSSVLLSYKEYESMKKVTEVYENLVLTVKLDKIMKMDELQDVSEEDLLNLLRDIDA